MDDRPRRPRGVGALAGAAAGGLVGVVDGVRAAVLFGTGFGAGLWTALLVAGADALLGLAAGGAVELVARVAAWGRGARTPLWARGLALGLGGVAPAVAAAAAVAATALRNNRFLAAGLTALAATAAAVAALVIAPALARLVARRRATVAPPWTPSPAGLLLGPVVIALFGALCFATVGALRRGLASAQLLRLELWVAIPAALLPAGLALVSSLRLPIRWRGAAVLAGTVYGGVAIAALARAWQDHLRFAPWRELIAGAVALAVGVLFVVRPPRRLPDAALRRAAVVCGVGLLAVVVLFRATASEPARKAAGARAGFAAWSSTAAGGARPRPRRLRAAARRRRLRRRRSRDPPRRRTSLPTTASIRTATARTPRDALPPPAAACAVPAGVPGRPEPAPRHHRHPARRSPRLLRLPAPDLAAPSTGWRPRGRCSRTAGRTRRRRATRCRRSPPGAGPRRSPGTRVDLVAAASARGRAPSARRCTALGYFTGALTLQLLRAATRARLRAGIDDYDDRPRRACTSTSTAPMESRGSSSREISRRRDRVRRRSREDRQFFLWVHYYDPHLGYEATPRCPPFGDVARRSATTARSASPTCTSGGCSSTCAQLGSGTAPPSSSPAITARASASTASPPRLSPLRAADQGAVHRARARAAAPRRVRDAGRPRRHRADAGEPGARPAGAHLPRAVDGRRTLDGATRAGTATRPVFQEVTSERGKKRAAGHATHHLIWNWMPDNTTECYDLRADPAERATCGAPARGPPARRWTAGSRTWCRAGASRPTSPRRWPRPSPRPAAPAPAPAHPARRPPGRGRRASGATTWPRRRSGAAARSTAATTSRQAAHRSRGLPALLPPGRAGWLPQPGPRPGRRAYPVERWRPGQRIRDRQRIVFPPGRRPGRTPSTSARPRRSERMPVEPPRAHRR